MYLYLGEEVFHHISSLQVLELEQQHSAALLQLTQSCNSEKEELITQHQLQLQVHLWQFVAVLA